NGTPPGKQWDVGIFNPIVSARLPNISANSGRNGVSSGLTSARMLNRYLVNVRGSSPGTDRAPTSPKRAVISASGVGSTCQIPERSGLPPTRGAGAARFTLPSLVRGAQGVG